LLPNLSYAGGFANNLQGETWVNDRIAHDKTRINANSFIKTTTHSASFVIGDNAFTLRPHSQVKFTPISQQSRSIITSLRLLTGGLLSVFGKGSKQLFTPAATIGIRGTDFEVSVRETDSEDGRAGIYDYVHDGATNVQLAQGPATVDQVDDAVAEPERRRQFHGARKRWSDLSRPSRSP